MFSFYCHILISPSLFSFVGELSITFHSLYILNITSTLFRLGPSLSLLHPSLHPCAPSPSLLLPSGPAWCVSNAVGLWLCVSDRLQAMRIWARLRQGAGISVRAATAPPLLPPPLLPPPLLLCKTSPPAPSPGPEWVSAASR